MEGERAGGTDNRVARALASELRTDLVRYPGSAANVSHLTRVAGMGTWLHKGLEKGRQRGKWDGHRPYVKREVSNTSFTNDLTRLADDLYLYQVPDKWHFPLWNIKFQKHAATNCVLLLFYRRRVVENRKVQIKKLSQPERCAMFCVTMYNDKYNNIILTDHDNFDSDIICIVICTHSDLRKKIFSSTCIYAHAPGVTSHWWKKVENIFNTSTLQVYPLNLTERFSQPPAVQKNQINIFENKMLNISWEDQNWKFEIWFLLTASSQSGTGVIQGPWVYHQH